MIEQDGDCFTIHTCSSLRNYLVKFKVGEEFDEDNKGLDNRKCKVQMKVLTYVLNFAGSGAFRLVVIEDPAFSSLPHAELGHLGQ